MSNIGIISVLYTRDTEYYKKNNYKNDREVKDN